MLGALEGVLYLDLDGDPNRDPYEPVFAGFGVELLDGATVIDTTTSAVNGSYRFDDVSAGGHTVRVVQSTIPSGYASAVDYDGGSNGSAVATVASGATTTGVDFGHRGTATVGDTVWLDENEDGSVDEFEEPIAGVAVTLTWWGFDDEEGTGDDHTFEPEITDDNGYCRFTELPPGGHTLTVDTSGVAVDLDPTTPTWVDVTLTAGETDLTGDFGFVASGDLPFTGLAADHLLLAAALMIVLGALVVADGRKRERKFDLAVWRIGK